MDISKMLREKHYRSFKLRHIPEESQTFELAMAAIECWSESLEDVRPDLQTTEMCRLAVILNPSEMEFVRPELQTHEMAVIVLLGSDESEYIRAQYVYEMIKAGANLQQYNQSVHDDIHNNIFRMMKEELESNFVHGRLGNGYTELPDYLIKYILDYYIKDINKAAADFIEYCDNPDDAKNPELDWIRDFCVAGYDMKIQFNDITIDIYDDIIKNISSL
jgi:hypothetical protein